MTNRCQWLTLYKSSQLMTDYHDREWGKPVHDDQKLFELLMLEIYQAGLSWEIVLNKRVAFNKQFKKFNPRTVAKMNNQDINAALNNPDIIRNRKKIEATINNAQRFLVVQKEFKTFDKYIWSFTDGQTIDHKVQDFQAIYQVGQDDLSRLISKDLKKRGFSFTGPTVVYSFLQANGMINDHEINCDFR